MFISNQSTVWLSAVWVYCMPCPQHTSAECIAFKKTARLIRSRGVPSHSGCTPQQNANGQHTKHWADRILIRGLLQSKRNVKRGREGWSWMPKCSNPTLASFNPEGEDEGRLQEVQYLHLLDHTADPLLRRKVSVTRWRAMCQGARHHQGQRTHSTSLKHLWGWQHGGAWRWRASVWSMDRAFCLNWPPSVPLTKARERTSGTHAEVHFKLGEHTHTHPHTPKANVGFPFGIRICLFLSH